MINNNDNSQETENKKLNYQKELLFFKDDILKDLKRFESKLTSKYNETQSSIQQKLNFYDEQFEKLTEKISKIQNSDLNDKLIEEKINSLIKFKEKISEKIMTNEIKLDSTQKDLQNAMFKYDKMFTDTVIYPGLIGNSCKYKTFHEFIDYLLIQISQLNSFKEKNILDLKSYKTKLENLIQSFKLQIENITKSMTEFTTKSVNNCEERINDLLKIYDEKLIEVRIENNKYSNNVKEEFDKMQKDWGKILQIKKDIYYKLDSEISNMKDTCNNVSLKFEGYKKEFNLIKNRFTQLSEFIKDVRFRANLGNGITKREAFNLSNQIDFTKKQVFIEPPKKDSYIKFVKSFKGNKFIDNFINKFSSDDTNVSKVNNGRKSVVINNPFVFNNSFDKPFDNSVNISKRQSVKNFFFGNKFIKSNSLSNINNSSSPNKDIMNNLNDDIKINSQMQITNYNNFNNTTNKFNDNTIISESNSDEKSEMNNITKLKIKKNLEENNNQKNNLFKHDNQNLSINNKIYLKNDNNKINEEKNINNKQIPIKKENENESYINNEKQNTKFPNVLDKSPTKKNNLNIEKVNQINRIKSAETLIQSKTHTHFPNINTNIKEKLILEQKDIKTSKPNNENLNEKKLSFQLTKTLKNENSTQIIHNKTFYNQSSININKQNQKDKNIININGMEIVNAFERKKNKYNKPNNSKLRIQKIQSYIKEIKSNIPDYNSFYNKYSGENEINDYNSINKKLKYNKSDHFYINSKSNYENKKQILFKNKTASHSNDKDLGDNYYFNLMINEDMNKTSVGLKKSTQNSYSNFNKK